DKTYTVAAEKYAGFLVRQMNRRPKDDAAGRLYDALRAERISPNLPEVKAINIAALEEAVILADANGRIDAGNGSGKDYFTRGRSFYNKSEWDAAIADLLKARVLDVGNRAVLDLLGKAANNRGVAYYKAGKYDVALKDFELAVQLRPDDPIAAKNVELTKAAMANALDKSKEDAEFESLHNRALYKKNLTAEEYFRLGQIYEKRGEWDSAGFRYDDASKRDKKNPLYLTKVGQMRIKNPDYISIAFEPLLGALKIDPHNRDANFYMGYLSVRKEDWDKAILYSSAAIETDPKMQNAYFNRAYSYRRKKDFDRAIADYETIQQLEPGNKEAKDKLAETRKEKNG
ncbi:MAG: tetratricopeptide repeat protein, partial [Chthonomonadales bacterium]